MKTGFTIWFTGLSGSGKSTLSLLLADRLRRAGEKAEVLDGDAIRTQVSRGLGFTKEDRDENVRRIGFICELLSRNGIIAIAAAISPYRAVREEIRVRVRTFVEIYVYCPLEVLIRRDRKGLYQRALAGEIQRFTGISDPYEAPVNPEILINSSIESPEESLERISSFLEKSALVNFGNVSAYRFRRMR